jgi:hypothetical protein
MNGTTHPATFFSAPRFRPRQFAGARIPCVRRDWGLTAKTPTHSSIEYPASRIFTRHSSGCGQCADVGDCRICPVQNLPSTNLRPINICNHPSSASGAAQ